MKAYELHPAEGTAALRMVERAAPTPGAGQVRVRVHATSLNYRDLIILGGAKASKTPRVPLSDGAGEVIEVGSGVTGLSVGDRVMAAFFPTWVSGHLQPEHHNQALGGSADGMLAEEVVLPAEAWVPVPAGWSYEEAATLPCAGVTAWNALFEAASLQPGQHVLVQGSGGVSTLALSLARAAGAHVHATSSSAEKRERLGAMGAETLIDYRAQPRWGDAVREACGEGADVVVEVGGAGTFNESAKALRYGGTLAMIGVLTGIEDRINTLAILQKGLRVHGIYVGSVAMFARLTAALEATSIRPVIDKTFAFDEAPKAYEHLQSGQHFGKVVVQVG